MIGCQSSVNEPRVAVIEPRAFVNELRAVVTELRAFVNEPRVAVIGNEPLIREILLLFLLLVLLGVSLVREHVLTYKK